MLRVNDGLLKYIPIRSSLQLNGLIVTIVLWILIEAHGQLQLGMGDIELLCCDNHPLKYHNHCKYHDIHLVGYNSTVKLKTKAYGIILCHMSRNFDVFRVYGLQLV